MFTGIIEELGTVVAFDRTGEAARITVEGPLAVSDATHGGSIAVNGLCLTVVEKRESTFTADVMKISIDTSTLSDVTVGDRVNLERAAAIGGRLGGHIVQGHIDGTATVIASEDGEAWRTVRFAIATELARLLTRKGSITLDGVSLTISDISAPAEVEQWFEVSLIPETIAATTLGLRSIGERVNVETDIVARHVERMLQFDALQSGAAR